MHLAGDAVVKRKTLGQKRLQSTFVARVKSIDGLLETQFILGAPERFAEAVGNLRDVPVE